MSIEYGNKFVWKASTIGCCYVNSSSGFACMCDERESSWWSVTRPGMATGKH